jgi:hypothetical protein
LFVVPRKLADSFGNLSDSFGNLVQGNSRFSIPLAVLRQYPVASPINEFNVWNALLASLIVAVREIFAILR